MMPATLPASLINLEAEASLIGSLMYDNSRVERMADVLTPSDFSEQIFGRIYSAIVDLTMQGRPANPVVIAPLFDGDQQFAELNGRSFLAGLTGSMIGIADPAPMARHVRELAVRRRLYEQMKVSAANLADLTQDIDLSIAAHDTALTSSIERTDPNPFRGGDDVVREVMSTFDRKIVGVTSGGTVSGIDNLIGSVRPGWLGIVAARPGMGKTAALVSYMRGAAKLGHSVLFASLEMTWQTLSLRMAADYCHAIGEPVPFSALMNGTTSRDDRVTLASATDGLAPLPFKIIDKRCHTLGQLRRAVRRRKRELLAIGKTLDLVIVDYLQLLQPDKAAKSEYEAVSEVSRELKLLASDEGVAIIALSQLSRAVEQRQDKRPMLSDLRASGQIEQDADFVIFLVSQEYYLRKAEPDPDSDDHTGWRAKMAKVEGWLEFICAKHRHGQEGNHFGRFYRAYQAVR